MATKKWMTRRTALLTTVSLLAAVSVGAQEIIDRIAAVVNDEIILLSEVEEKLFIAQAQGQLKDADSTKVSAVRKEVLERLVEEKLVVQRATSQGIKLESSEVLAQVDDAMGDVRKRFPTDQAFHEALAAEGISETMLRERYEADIRQELMGQRIVAREVRSKINLSSDEVQRYYSEHKSEIPARPDEIHLAHLLVTPITAEREKAARDKIEAARRRIEGGETFEAVAKDVSDDASRSRGGLLGRFHPGDLDPDFQAAVDTLALKTLSPPVRSQFGWHLIEVLDRTDKDFEVRHIVVLVEPLPEDVDRAQAKAEAARRRILSGESFAKVVAEASDDELTRDRGGDLGWAALPTLVPDIAQVVDSLEVEQVSPVVRGGRGFHVFKVLERRAGGEYAYDEIETRLRALLEQRKLEEEYDKWMTAVRDSAYVEIKAW